MNRFMGYIQHIVAAIFFVALGFIATVSASPNLKPPPFQFVNIDAATEAKLGAFPIDRAHIAKVVDVLTQAGAKAIVLKFFYDLPSNAASDGALQKALSKSNVLLQARIDDTEPKPNALPAKFFIDSAEANAVISSISGKSGWLPLPSFANVATSIGFVDATDVNNVPGIVRYQGNAVYSLTVATVQAALDSAPPRLDAGKFIYFKKHRLALDTKNQILLSANALNEKNSVNKIPTLSFIDLINGNFLPADISGKVIIVGYDGNKSHQFETKFGMIEAHRVFYLGLVDAWRQLQAE